MNLRLFFCALWLYTAAPPLTAHAQEKVASPFRAALAQARSEKKLVFLEFKATGCLHCMAFQRKVLSTPEWQEFQKANLVMLIYDLQPPKPPPAEVEKEREALANRFGVVGTPHIVILTGDERELKRISGYAGQSAQAIIEAIQKLKLESTP